ncbi:MAG TPA: tetratricopeptide repeat protein [Bryobacteraceae bacterium]|nr:tetratricopeptide repeat protein [Bryobacteraceae bacterium]
MRRFWIDCRLLSAVPAIAVLLVIPPAFAQKGGSPSSSGAGNAGSGSASRGNVPTNPTPNIGNTPSTTTSPSMTRPIFLSGKVMFDDGSQTNPDIRIERVCGGSSRTEAHTDSKGRFSFQVGQNPMAFADASDSPGDPFGSPGGRLGSSPSGFGGMTGMSSNNQTNPLWNCELRASYPGFRSDVVDLSTRRSLDDPDVGTIVLHRLVNVKGSTISVTSELAPKHAQKAYQKGLQQAQKGKLDEAEKDLGEATDLYPKYALAWYALGQVQQQEGKRDLARKSYLAASTADSKFLSPYDRLAFLSAQDGKWDESADYSKHVIDMNPVEFPTSFWYNALANYQLHKPAEAEKSDAELLKLDTQHHFPEAENLMAQLQLEKGNYTEAATHLRTYLKLSPNATNADSLKAILLKIDQANAQTKPQPPPQ